MRCFFCCIFFFLFLSGFAQEEHEYVGAIQLGEDKKQMISFLINFSVKDTLISGYTITDLNGEHETKNIITGNYDLKTKKIAFSEKEIVYTKSSLEKETFCLINFYSNTKFNKKAIKIEGDFVGKFPDGNPCMNGSIIAVRMAKIEKIVEKVTAKIEKSKKLTVEEKKKFNPKKLLDSMTIKRLSKNENLNIFVKKPEVMISFWDVGQEDGDKINLFHDGKLVLRDYVVTAQKNHKLIKLHEGENKFKMVALNEGELSPNTPKIELLSDDKRFETMGFLHKKESAIITVIYKPE